MSNGNVVDSKIVELALNNQQFESNARTSISTLDKLKNALKFSGSSKNFDDMNKSLGKIDVKSLSSGVNDLRMSLNNLKNVVVFSWIADEAIKAKNAVEGFIKSVTTDQIAAGFGKYAEKTSAVQTIMSATASAYSDTEEQMADVNAQLEKLNWFTDETSYSFLDMVNNIGKFTSNNIGLEQSITAMQGISTWAAKSGADIGEAGRAMYNLSQAVAVGSVKLMDWKSIENANMATAEFKQTAIETAESMNMLTKASDDTWKTLEGHEVSVRNFNAALSDGWFTSDVLLKTLDNYGAFTNQLYESIGVLNDEFIASDMLEFIEEYKDGSLDLNEAVKGTSVSTTALKAELDKLSSTEMEFGLKAFKAAQEAKTFEEAVESVKDAASTGWMNTFELMFGDYLQAKELWTTLANDLYEIFAEGGNTRNEILKEAFGTQEAANEADFKLLTTTGVASDEFIDAVRRNARMHGVYIDMMADRQVWFKDAMERGLVTMDDLNSAYEEIYSSNEVDTALKEQVESLAETDESFKSLLDTVKEYNAEDLKKINFGDGKYTEGLEEMEENLDSMIKSLGLTQEEGSALVDVLIAIKNGGEGAAEKVKQLSDEQLATIGYSEETIAELRDLQEQGKLTDQAVIDLINNQHKSGGQMWTEALYNGMEAILNIVLTAKDAFWEMLPSPTASGIYDFIKKLHDFSEQIKTATTESKGLKAVFTGFFGVLDIVRRAIGAVISIITGSFSAIVDELGIDFGAMAVNVGKAATAVHDWIAENKIFETISSVVTGKVREGAKAVKGWVDSFLSLPVVQNNLKRFRIAFDGIFSNAGSYFSGMPTAVDAFRKRLDKLGKIDFGNVGEVLTAFKDTIWNYFVNFPGFKALNEAFRFLWKDIKGGLSSVGIDGEKIESTFIKVKDAVSGALGSIPEKAQAAYTKISGLWTQFKQMPVVQKNVEKFKTAFSTLGTKLTPFFSGLGTKFGEFKKEIKGLDGISFANIGKAFGSFKTTVLDYITNFDGFQGIKDAFSGLWEDVKAGLATNGIDIDAILAPFANIGTRIWTFLSDSFTNVTTFFTDAFADFDLTEFATGLDGAINDFLGRVGELDGISLDNVLEVFSSFKDTIVNYFTNFEGFDGLKEAVQNLWTDIVAKFDSFGLDLDGFIERVKSFAAGVKEAFLSIFDIFSGKGEESPEGAGKEVKSFGDKISEAFDKIKAAFKGIDVNAIIALAGAFLLYKTVGFVANAFKSYATLIGAKSKELKSRALLEMAAALGILAFAMYQLSKLKRGDLAKGAAAIGGLMVVLGVFSVIIGKIGADAEKMKGTGAALLMISASLLILIVALKAMEYLDENKLEGNLETLAKLAGALALLSLVLKVAGAGFGGGAAILAIVGSMFLMLGLLKILDQFKLEHPEEVLLRLISLVGAMALVFIILLPIGSLAKGSATTILAISASFILLAGAMLLLTLIPNDIATIGKLIACMITISVCLGIVLRMAGEVKGATGTIIALAFLFGVLTAALVILSLMPLDRLIPAAIILGVLMAVLGSVIKQISKLDAKNALPSVIAISLLVGVLAAVLWAMSELGVENALPNAIAIGILMLALSGSLYIIGKMGKTLNEALWGLVKIAGVIALIIGVTGLLGYFVGKIDEDTRKQVLSGLTFIGDIAEKIGEVLGKFLGGIVLGSATVLPELALIIKEFSDNMQDVKPIPLGGLASFGEALAAIALIDFVGFFGSVASFVNMVADGQSNVEQFADDLTALARGLTDWQTAMNEIDEIEIPSEAITELTGLLALIDFSGFFGSLESFVNMVSDGQSNVEQFADDLTALSGGLQNWQTAMETIDEITIPEDAINSLINVVDRINFSGLFTSIVDAVVTLFTGQNTMDQFISNLGKLSGGLSDWQTKMEGIKEIKIPTEAIDDLLDAIKDISFAGIISAFEGWVTELLGGSGDPMADFSEKVGTLGDTLTDWKAKMDTIGTISVPTDAVDDLVKAIDAVPKSGIFTKMKNFFTGSPDFDAFKENITKMGDALGAFSTALGEGFNAEAAAGAASMISAVSALGEAFKDTKITDTTGFFGGTKEGILTKLGKAIVDFGGYLQEFSNIEMDTSKLTEMSAASESMAHVAEIMSSFEVSGDIINSTIMNNFKTGIETLKTSIGSLSDLNTGGVDKLKQAASDLGTIDLESAVTNLQKANNPQVGATGSSVGSDMANSVTSGISDASGAMATAMEGAVSAAADAVSTSGFSEKGAALVNAIKSGIEGNASGVINAINAVISSAKVAANSASDGVSSAGLNFAQGFANGIRSGSYLAEAAAYAIGKAALRKLQAATEEHSPSKAAYRIGDYVGVGFTNGIDNNLTSSYRSGRGIARAAMGGLKDAAKSIKDILESDLDAQPVVRPVLDLSEIQNGAGSIGDMLNTSPIGITGNLTAINRNVNGRSMTSNDDVVSAISQLRRSLNSNNLGTHNTYNVNGVTYDDGTNISNAVGDLVRAIRVERRA